MDLLGQVDDQILKDIGVSAAGDRLRIEISSSNFPLYERNLNTGGNNFDETQGVVAHNQVHHSSAYPSSITLSVVEP